MKLYLIPGLGFDQQMFGKLGLDNFDLSYINWKEPKRDESIRDYAGRLSVAIDVSAGPVVLIGHSMGGMVAQEISCLIKIQKIILLSSIKSREEMPLFFRLAWPLGLHRIFTKELCLRSIKYWGKSHGYETPEEQALFKCMVENQTNSYLQWALKTLSKWQTPLVPENTKRFHIHGNNDKTFPVRLIQNPDVVIEKGSHFMTYQNGDEITRLIRRELENS